MQQAVPSLAEVPSDMSQGSGAVFYTMGARVPYFFVVDVPDYSLGFEYWGRPNDFITWQVDGHQFNELERAP